MHNTGVGRPTQVSFRSIRQLSWPREEFVLRLLTGRWQTEFASPNLGKAVGLGQISKQQRCLKAVGLTAF
jgi:hypothetical protein